MVFKIGSNDYSKHVLLDTYDVNQEDIYTQWEDANGTTHRSIYRTKVSGSFEMKFTSLAEYAAFIAVVEGAKTNGGYVPLLLAINNLNQENILVNAFVQYTPIRSRHGNYTKIYNSFTFSLEER